MTTTLAGVPRVRLAKKVRAKPLEATTKRDDPKAKKKKEKAELDAADDILNGWRKK